MIELLSQSDKDRNDMNEKRERLLSRFIEIQNAFDRLCQPLTQEEYRIQPMIEASPPWWSVMHTAWFYARNILKLFGDYRCEDQKYDILLNSYYHALGTYLDQGIRGKLSEPTNSMAWEYRKSVRERMKDIMMSVDENSLPRLEFLLAIAVNHEQQHMELLVTEVKRIKAENPVIELRRPYKIGSTEIPAKSPGEAFFVPFTEGWAEYGNVEGGWCWDNELGVHKHHLKGFALMNRLVTNGEYMEFMEDGAYRNFGLWLSSAYDAFIRKGLIQSPLYWQKTGDEWRIWTLSGMKSVDPDEPVCHVNFYEAHAFAMWKSDTDARYRGARLPTEHEWEFAARSSGAVIEGNLMDTGRYHPATVGETPGLTQLIGDVWEWTTSHYEPYPGYRPFPEGLVEYNSKFMNNTRVLRGGSCATPKDHMRISYRNFWSPATQWQFTGIRLAKDLE